MGDEKQTFEQILTELKAIVHDLEEGELSLENALTRFEQGIKLSREGAKRLEEVELKVEEILGDGATRPLDIEEG